MIYEYAVEPALVARWAKDGVVGLAGQFGLDQRRVVSDLPTYWTGEVFAALLEEFEYDDGDPNYLQASAFLNGLLAFMNAQVVSRGLTLQTDRPWLDQALEIHAQEPFYAVLARSPLAGHAAVITERIVDQLQDQRWYLPTVKPTPKTCEDLAATLASLLRGATKIVIVDPYFDPRDANYRDVLAALLARAAQLRGPGRMMPSVELIAGVADAGRISTGRAVAMSSSSTRGCSRQPCRPRRSWLLRSRQPNLQRRLPQVNRR